MLKSDQLQADIDKKVVSYVTNLQMGQLLINLAVQCTANSIKQGIHRRLESGLQCYNSFTGRPHVASTWPAGCMPGQQVVCQVSRLHARLADCMPGQQIVCQISKSCVRGTYM